MLKSAGDHLGRSHSRSDRRWEPRGVAVDVAGRGYALGLCCGHSHGIPDELEVAWRVTPTLALRETWEVLRKN